MDDWKFVFCEQRRQGTLEIWGEPFTCMRVFKIFNLRMDPYERADITSNTYWDWVLRHAFFATPVQARVAAFLTTFKDYPPSQRPASFNLDRVMEKLQQSMSQAK